MKDYWKTIRNYHGVISQHTALNGLIRVRSAVDYYIKQGDLELAHAVVHASNDQRLEWLANDFAKTSSSIRYGIVRQRTLDYEPDLHYQTLLLKPKKGAEAQLQKLQAETKVKFDQIVKDLAKFTEEQIMLSSTWVNQGVIPSMTEIRSLIDSETLVIDIVQARSLADKPYSINARDRRIYAGAAFDQTGVYGPVVIGDTEPIDALVKAITAGMRAPTDQPDTSLVANASKLR